ncbi:hypothetical protein A4H97_30095 [Niastella yeongjuensis]|uniref:Endonuclease GajA/Old nuclease/RecF-like AAA domain-containing protein n=1 Tax=Niastella yeongjuensis TaxID=354355 RepID=A0A1V9EPU8_9BACT|nr:AAA family ATPase [Niastella yeongjuensis]OQP48111.1 hypothetical protein A4H97_30095 [Niastella yeongjuensis]SEO26157.1 hypothetical protein SAMN05660816_02420 [Niastella yeongjuensis]
MLEAIPSISIKNFKSIRDLQISDCSRINLFIGKPNVGKSNILEALSTFSIPYLRENPTRKLSHLIRLESETELFYNGNTESAAEIDIAIGSCAMAFNPKEGLKARLSLHNQLWEDLRIDDKLIVKGINTPTSFDVPVKKYQYKHNVAYKRSHSKYLVPPFGSNLLSIIENYDELKQQVVALFREYNLEIAFDKGSQTIKVVQNKQDGLFLIPYNSIADTLQRIIFYKSAIASNNNSILLFEEPEAHSFPPYMTHLTQEIIYKKDNQYFIATHSPFILNDLLENGRDELSVYMVDFRDGQTVVNRLSSDQLYEIFQNGVDLFTNSESYL